MYHGCHCKPYINIFIYNMNIRDVSIWNKCSWTNCPEFVVRHKFSCLPYDFWLFSLHPFFFSIISIFANCQLLWIGASFVNLLGFFSPPQLLTPLVPGLFSFSHIVPAASCTLLTQSVRNICESYCVRIIPLLRKRSNGHTGGLCPLPATWVRRAF